MVRKRSKEEEVGECVSLCYTEDFYGDKSLFLAELLWAIAKGTKWEEDARSGIEGVCPHFFEES